MPVFKKITGNYTEVLAEIGLPATLSDPQKTKDAYLAEVEKDLFRTSYLSFNTTVALMKESLKNTSNLKPDTYSFTQGNFDGSVFTDNRLKHLPQFFKTARLSLSENTTEGAYDNLRIAFIDDSGINCGLSISYLREDADTESGEALVPIAQRKRRFTVAFIKNTNAAPNERQVTILSPPDFLKGVAKNATEIDVEALPAELNKIINSKGFSALLSGIFKGDSISEVPFNELQDRLRTNQNLDNRDNKKEYLTELSNVARKMLPDDAELQKYVDEINQRALNDLNFFKKGDFETTLETFFNKVNKHLLQLADKSKAEQFLLNIKLSYFAIKLALNSFEVSHDQAGENLKQELLSQAQKLKSLSDNQPDEAARFKDMTFVQLNSQIENKVAKVAELNRLIKSALGRLSFNPDAQTYLESLQNEALQNPDFLIEEHFKQIMASVAVQTESYVAKKETEEAVALNKLLADIIEKFERAIADLNEQAPQFVRQGLLAKANELRHLKPDEKKQYKGSEFEPMLANTLKDIYIANIKREADGLKNSFPMPAAAVSLKNPGGSFFQRNRAALLTGVFFILAVISIALILTGVLAPIGLVLGAGTATVAATAGIVVGSGVAVGAGVKVRLDELEFAHQQIVDERVQEVRRTHNEIDEKCRADVLKFRKSFKDVELPKIKAEIFKEKILVQESAHSEKPSRTSASPKPGVVEAADHLLLEVAQLVSVAEAELSKGLVTNVPLPTVAQGHKPPETANEAGPAVVEADTTNRIK